jgi:hypothetical protein
MRLVPILCTSIGSCFVLTLMRIVIQKKSMKITVKTNLAGIQTRLELMLVVYATNRVINDLGR